MSFVFADTPYTFSVIDSFDSEEFEGFGNDNALALFTNALERFQAEYELSGNDVRMRKKIGSTADYQFRFGHNVKTFSKSVNTSNLSTYIKGYGKKIEQADILFESKNYESKTGTWADTSDPIHYTTQVGATFRASFTGTGVQMRHWSDRDGGVWEVVIDGSKRKNVSTWAKTEGRKVIDLFRDLPDGNHTLVATFKGADPNHKPHSGTARGWIHYGPTYKTLELFRPRVGDEFYATVAEYTSPDAGKYPRIKHAPPYQSDSITNYTTLLRKIKTLIQEKPEMTFEIEATQLPYVNLGDIIPTIYEPLGIDVDLRVMEIEEYPESKKAPKVVLSNALKTFAGAINNYNKALLDKIYDEASGKLRYNVYDEAVKRATEALNNSLTELQYPAGMGIVAVDPNDPLRFVALRSAGLGVTTDGGVTFANAITADGVTTNLLTAGQIKTNNVQIIGNDDLFYWDGNALIAINAADPNKFTRLNSSGLYTAGGALTVEGKDGRVWVQDGIVRNSLVVQQTTPVFYGDTITEVARYFRATSSDYDFIGAYQMNHEGRYLVIEGYAIVNEAGVGVAVESYAGLGFYQTTTIARDTSATGAKPFTITLDLGKPTYARSLFYIKMRSDNAPNPGRCRINWVTQYG